MWQACQIAISKWVRAFRQATANHNNNAQTIEPNQTCLAGRNSPVALRMAVWRGPVRNHCKLRVHLIMDRHHHEDHISQSQSARQKHGCMLNLKVTL